MANTFITNTARFKPFSFQEMLQPYQIYTEAYNAYSDELANLDIMVGDIASKLTSPADAELQKTYQKYQDDLNTAMEDFYSKGLTADSRKKLAGLKARYTKELNPINEAYKAYQTDQQYLVKMAREHPEMLIERVGSSISDYMNGNTPVGISANLNAITESSRLDSAGLSKQFVNSIGLQNVDGYIGRYLMYGKSKGLNADMVKDFTNFVDSGEVLNTEGGKALYNLFEKERQSSNYYNMSSEAQKKIDASIVKGLIQGVSYDEDFNYIGDNYWDIEGKKQQIELTRAKLQAERDKLNNDSDLDLRTDATLYRGVNFDVSQIAALMGEQFENPIDYNGTKIYDPIQAYNIIHKDDARIEEISKILEEAKNKGVKTHSFISGNSFNNFDKKTVFINTEGFSEEEINNLNSLVSTMENLIFMRDSRYKDLDGIALTDKEVARVRKYSGSSSTGMLTQNELTNFAVKLETDFTAGQYNEEAVTIFSHTNSKKGLEDAVDSISKNITTRIEAGVELNITTSDGKYVKSKEIEKLLDANGRIDNNKIQSLDIDFRAAQTGTVKMITTSGKVYYVDATYLGTQANNFINGANGLFSQYEEIMRSNITGKTKAELLNRRLASTASSIQNQYDLNRNQAMSETISNTDLFEE